GLAPLRAIAEHAAASGSSAASAASGSSGRHRQVHLVLAVRTERDLYDLPGLRLLEAAYPGLHVVPVVSDEVTPNEADEPDAPDGGRPRGAAVAEALERLGDWSEHEVYLAGPAAMIRATAARLRDLGVPPERIHHDLREAERQEDALTRARTGNSGRQGEEEPAATCPIASRSASEGHQPARARRNSDVVTSAG
ncbi:hypothetical protein AB0J52_22625, partial [Spirillospora sp. NPDC049652]